MSFAEILHLTVRHAYYGDSAVPVRIAPADARSFARDGLMMKADRGSAVVIGDPEAEDLPQTVALKLVAQTPDLFALTDGADARKARHLHVPQGQDDVRFADATPPKQTPKRSPDAPQVLSGEFIGLSIALPDPADWPRRVTLRCDTVSALWAYHVTGPRAGEPLEIVDTTGKARFDDLGTQFLPGGQTTRILRSREPIALRARSDVKFKLQVQGQFDPDTIIPRLPVGGARLKPITDPGAAARLQSDIFITLW